ncbi:MAG TPA: hypothetical protein VHN14_06235 [Kofleriaceae bacterium]|jgi:hypothetical protein|nr:hypothetical protein [Kofleriaceae bacterium]
MRAPAFAMLLFSISCAGEEPRHVPQAHAPVALARARAELPVAADPRAATRRAAHDMLAEHCGECHEGHRATAQPKALAVFDLDKADWPMRFDEHRYQAALRRLAKQPPAVREAFIAFRDAELASSSAKAN